MLLPSEIDNITEYINRHFVVLEDELVGEIADRISRVNEANIVVLNQANVLNQMGLLNREVYKKVAIATNKTEKDIKDIMSKSMITSFKRDNIIFSNELSKEKLKISESLLQTLQADISRLNYDLNNLTGTTAMTTQTAFINAVNQAHLEVISGASSYTSAMIKAVDKVSKDGVDVLYPSGHRDKVDVATRRAIVTSVNQTNGELQLRRMQDLDWDLVEVSAHIGARPTHAVWQGQVYSLTGKGGYKNFYEETEYGTMLGLCGINCRHTFFPFYEGSTYTYHTKQLEEINNKKVLFNGKEMTYYQATQYQRRLERAIRKCNRRLDGNSKLLLNNKDVDVEQVKYSIKKIRADKRGYLNELSELEKQVGLKNSRLYGVGSEVKLYKIPKVENTTFSKVKKDVIIEKAKPINSEILRRLKIHNILEIPVQKLKKKLSENEIIKRIGGGDLTQGSCSSLAFAFIGNVNGLDVIDFRGGGSWRFFSLLSNIVDISKIEGAETIVVKGYNEIKDSLEILSQLKENKNYYFSSGRHASIVRKVEGKYEYLELQTENNNGFHRLTTDELRYRFGCRRSRTSQGVKLTSTSLAIECDSLKNNEEFKQILGFINTEKSKQLKGVSGYAK